MHNVSANTLRFTSSFTVIRLIWMSLGNLLRPRVVSEWASLFSAPHSRPVSFGFGIFSMF